MAYHHRTPYTATKLPYGTTPAPLHPAHRVHRESKMYQAFKRLAGEDNEVDPWELQDILNNTMKKDSELRNVTFSLDSCRSMIAMCDNDRSGKLGYEEFLDLWKNINAWTKIFRRYDQDGSGTFSGRELHTALTSLGYKMDIKIYQALVLRYADKDSQITFDSFISCAIKLRHMFEVYNKYIDASDRKATFNLEEFVKATMYS